VTRALLVAATLLALAGEVAAAAFTLGEAEKRAAIRAGERSRTEEQFDREWRVVSGEETATVLTPFHRLVIAARHAAFKNGTLKPNEVERVLKQDAGRLLLSVELRGRTEGFARYYTPRLQAGPREIAPAFVQNERTALRQDDGVYVARCLYGFPIRDLNGGGRVELTVADAEGRKVSRFTIDLASMR
jgi:hypothetical protein